jgi:hypothetical protein
VIVCVAGLARAEERREVAVALRWHPADGCLDTAGLYQLVHPRRRPVGSPDEADAVVSGRARVSAAGGWEVELVVADRRGAILGRRSLEVAGGGCAALREHVAVVVAMLVDSSVVERAASPAPPAPPPVRRDRSWQGDAGIGLVGEIGRLPGREWGARATFGLTSRDGWRGALELLAFAGSSAHDEIGETTIRWLGGALAGCRRGPGRRAWPWLRRMVCVGVEGGVMRAEGSGFARNQRDQTLLIDLLVDARAEVPLVGPTFLALPLTARGALLRPRFGYEDETGTFTQLYAPKTFAITVGVGVGAYFP